MKQYKDANMSDITATTMADALKDDKVLKALQAHLVAVGGEEQRYDFSKNTNIKTYVITGITEEEEALPILTIPVKVKAVDGKDWLFLDVRKYVRPVEHEKDLMDMARDASGLTFERIRFLLTREGMSGELSHLDQARVFLSKQMGSWLASAYSAATYPLDPDDRLRFMLGVFIYISSSTVADIKVDRGILLASIIKQYKLSPKYAKDVIESLNPDIDYGYGLPKLVAILKQLLSETVAENISAVTLTQAIMNTWYGPNRFHNIPVALENLPTWTAILYTASTQRSYKKSPLNTMVAKFAKKSEVEGFVKTIDGFMFNETTSA